jgi:hypothetical protein
MSNDPNLIVRYTANERTNHWITAISFVVLALSGLALFHPSMFWLTALFGGGQWTRILHPFVGLVMFVSFLILAVRFWHQGLWCISMLLSGSRGRLGLWCAVLLRWGGPGSIILSGVGLSLHSYWFISDAPVRGGTYFLCPTGTTFGSPPQRK